MGLSRYALAIQDELAELRHQALGLESWDSYDWQRRATRLLLDVRKAIREDAPTVTTRRKRVERDDRARAGAGDVFYRINPEIGRRTWALHREQFASALAEITVLRAVRDEVADGIKALESWRAWDRRERARISALIKRALAS